MMTVERRPPTQQERAIAFPKTSAMRRADSVAWCIAPVLGLATIGWLAQLLIRAIGWNVAPWPVVVGAVLGVPLSVLMIRSWARHAREQRHRKLDVVEVLHVAGARYAEMEEHNDEGPHYFVQVGSEKLLVLSGQWMFDPHVVDGDEFPSTDFDLVRDPATGQVLHLRPRGVQATPERTYKMKELPLGPEFAFGMSGTLFQGSLDDLPAAIATASEQARQRR